MKKFIAPSIMSVFIMLSLMTGMVGVGRVSAAESVTPCALKTDFLGLPTWYKYLPGKTNPGGSCDPQITCDGTGTDQAVSENCNSQSGIDISKLWLIGLAILDLLFRLGGIIAVGVVVYGGIKYITSQGQPDATKGARQTIINACIGIGITIIASLTVNFLAKLLQ